MYRNRVARSRGRQINRVNHPKTAQTKVYVGPTQPNLVFNVPCMKEELPLAAVTTQALPLYPR